MILTVAERGKLTEERVWELVRKRTGKAGRHVLIGQGDDAAVIEPAGAKGLLQVLTTDMLVEGVHFSQRIAGSGNEGFRGIGYKALAVCLSDIAAMGAAPKFALGYLGMPPKTQEKQAAALLDGVMEAAAPHSVQLIGGDTVAAPQWVVGFTVIGELAGSPLLRSGAQPGDVIWHSGSLGLSQTGLHELWADGRTSRAAKEAHLRPQAQVGLGTWLQQSGIATACIDTSDSLSRSLVLLAEASGCGMEIDFRDYPFAPEVQRFAAARRRVKRIGAHGFRVPKRMDPAGKAAEYGSLADYMLASSEDYQLLFTAPETATKKLLKNNAASLTRLGDVKAKRSGMHYSDESGKRAPLTATGFTHS